MPREQTVSTPPSVFNQQSDAMPTPLSTETRSDFVVELADVYTLMADAAASLELPLQQLVRSQIQRTAPYARAGVVLAAGLPSVDTATSRAQRVFLAAALEMLYVAHNVHKLLLNPDAETMDKSLMGSTILAGDYCFSHSADLAVKTNNAMVVRLFSEALKRVSEGNIRDRFQDVESFNENTELFTSGLRAAAELTSTGPLQRNDALSVATRLTECFMRQAVADEKLLASFPAHQDARWQELLASWQTT